jgi:hypothetical protein
LESAANSGSGGTISATATTFQLGDDASNRAYRPLLSFDTAGLPDNATITEATIGITRTGTVVGNIPIGVANPTFGEIWVDVTNGSINGNAALENADWQAGPGKAAASKFAWPAYLDGMTIFSRLETPDLGFVNKLGKTQYRVRYQYDDDNDNTADNMSFASANHATVALRPTLKVKYSLPAGTYTQLMFDNFETGFGNWIDGGANCARTSSNAHQGTYSIDLQDDTAATAAMSTAALDFHNPGYVKIKVDFWYKAIGMETGENFYVEFFNGTAWVVVADYVSGTHFTNNTFAQASVIIDEQLHTFATNGRVRIRCDASDGTDDIYVDEVMISTSNQ